MNGSNDFSVKVSSDTGQWREAIKIDHATGNVAVASIWPQTRLHFDGPIRLDAALPAIHGAGAWSTSLMLHRILNWSILMAPTGAAFAAALSLLKACFPKAGTGFGIRYA
ncbi:Uncharacterised protein [Brucella anthropi]|nr:Uncharacterised protein [Brucella anthropi]